MPSLALALSALAFVSFALATPIRRAQQTFTLYESVPKPFTRGPVLLLKAYEKFGATPPADVLAAATNGSVTARPEQHDRDYLCPVTIGGQTLNLDFDTGSADLWVFSTETLPWESAGHIVYNPSLSKTARELPGYTWIVTYGDGSSSSGNVYTDDVTVGGITVTKQAVGLAEQVSSQFVPDTQLDGFFGLAFSSINTIAPQPQTTFFDTAINEGVLEAPVFTADLKKGAPGSYDFGFIDSTKYTGSIAYVPVNNANGYWEFTGAGYAVGSGQFQSTSIDAIADTGTSLLLLDDDIVSAYYAEVSGAYYDGNEGGYVFPCTATLPSFTLKIGSYDAVIPGTYMNYAPLTETSCFGGLQSNDGIGFSIYGDIFLKSQFVVFDSGNTQLGVAAKDL